MSWLIAFLLCIAISVSVSLITYKVLKIEVFGGFYGILIVTFLGAVSGFGLHYILIFVHKFFLLIFDILYLLMGMKGAFPPIDLISATLGSILFIYILKKITPKK